MQRCSKVVALLVDYLERRLPPEVRSQLEHHLARCEVCLRQLRTYESTVSLLHSIREDELPPELRYSLRAFLDQKRCCDN
ncbi:MAG TPA: zf-HC2 domain-containing protein [Vicinamibacterales bacterium]|nr:zf-HC2 domain-containing protein [Vicinamibacterales bacterium]